MERKLKGILKNAKSTSMSGMKPIRVLNNQSDVSSPSSIQFSNKVDTHVYEGNDDTETEAMRDLIAENLRQLKTDVVCPKPVAAASSKPDSVETQVSAACPTQGCVDSKQQQGMEGYPNQGFAGSKQQQEMNGSMNHGLPSVEEVFESDKPFVFPVVKQAGMSVKKSADPCKLSYKDSMLLGSSRAANEGSFDAKSGQSDDRKVNFRFLHCESNDDVDVLFSKDSVQRAHDRYKNVLYGYFLGDRLAYPVVEFFAKNAWSKYGFNRIMMNSKGFFFFKFDSSEGMENVIRDGPWLIRNNPIFLNFWSPSMVLKKEDMGKISVWVKLHDVPLAAYTEDGLSLLASKIGTPKRLDKYTSDMCLDSWGRSSYARAIIEISADQDLKESISVAIPHLDGEGFSRGLVRVEYEWRPPRCSKCCVFGHNLDSCPLCVTKPVIITPQAQTSNDGFTEVLRKKSKKHRVQVSKPKPKVEYRPVQKQKVSSTLYKNKSVRNSNPFNAFNLKGYDSNGVPVDDLQDEGFEDLLLEKDSGLHSFSGASTPAGVTSYG